MISLSNIAVIDDQEDQLEDIQKAFFSAGIPCLPIHYRYDLKDNKSGIDHIELNGLKPRIIVTDLNLRNGSLNNTMELVPPIVELLKKLSPEGPFLLIFWSAIKEQVESVIKVIQERFYNEVPFPIHYDCIDKPSYRGVENAVALREKLKAVINKSQLFNALLDWETRVTKAAKETTNSLFELTRPSELTADENYQIKHIGELENVLAKIGNEAIGQKNAKEEPGVAIDSGLAPVLFDHLHSMSINDEIWKSAIPSIGVKVDLPSDIKATLNSFYHTEKIGSNFPKNCKGVFVELSPAILSDLDKKRKFENRMGRTIDEILEEEFISKSTIESVNKDEKARLFNEAKQKIMLGFIEVSASCDQAQKKTKLHKYLLAALIPSECKELTKFRFNGVFKETAHDGIYKTPDIFINKEKFTLKISYKYQIGTVPNSKVNDIQYNNAWLGKPIFRLREQILTDISFRCAQYSSRPGIICFQ